ncbi:MAG: nucleoside monophosphate kinase [Candidatus Paceibacterota bacterium]|jgi:adenylate kinase family enzyme
MHPQTFIFIGRSGSGKGTQAELLKKYLDEEVVGTRDVLYIETGPRFRNFIKEDTFSSKLSKEAYDNADLQPSFLAVWMWASILIEKMKGDEHLIIDGTPRALPEAKVLSTALDFYSRNGAHVIYLNVSRSWTEKRLLERGRVEDATFTKRNKRMDWFDREVFPTIEYLKNDDRYHLYDVNGEQTVADVHKEIIARIFSDKFLA